MTKETDIKEVKYQNHWLDFIASNTFRKLTLDDLKELENYFDKTLSLMWDKCHEKMRLEEGDRCPECKDGTMGEHDGDLICTWCEYFVPRDKSHKEKHDYKSINGKGKKAIYNTSKG